MPKTSNICAGDFLRALPWTIPVEWFADEGIHRIDDDRRAKLRLTRTHNGGGEWNAVHVEILSKTSGKITVGTLPFDTYLDRSDRADDRADWRPTRGEDTYKIIDHCGWDWYIAIPACTNPLVDAVEAWIDQWR